MVKFLSPNEISLQYFGSICISLRSILLYYNFIDILGIEISSNRVFNTLRIVRLIGEMYMKCHWLVINRDRARKTIDPGVC